MQTYSRRSDCQTITSTGAHNEPNLISENAGLFFSILLSFPRISLKEVASLTFITTQKPAYLNYLFVFFKRMHKSHEACKQSQKNRQHDFRKNYNFSSFFAEDGAAVKRFITSSSLS